MGQISLKLHNKYMLKAENIIYNSEGSNDHFFVLRLWNTMKTRLYLITLFIIHWSREAFWVLLITGNIIVLFFHSHLNSSKTYEMETLRCFPILSKIFHCQVLETQDQHDFRPHLLSTITFFPGEYSNDQNIKNNSIYLMELLGGLNVMW